MVRSFGILGEQRDNGDRNSAQMSAHAAERPFKCAGSERNASGGIRAGAQQMYLPRKSTDV